MKLRTAIAIATAAVLAASVASLGGVGIKAEAQRAHRGYGHVVARDSAKDNPAAAVARVTLSDFRSVSYRITANPKRTKVDWGITARCVKGSLIDYWPGPGDFKTGTKKAGFGGHIRVPLADPDFCTFSVAGQTFKHDAGKRVTVKLYSKG